MGKFKDVGEPSLVLMEELAEAIQVIAKKHRFEGEWNEIPDGKTETRWEELQAEMADVFYQWFRLKEEIMGKVIHIDNDGL
jgi:NTP pyrophosphatase (non-canonical NTP hydrolase)